MDGNLSDVQRLLKNGKKSYSFAAHYKQNFKPKTSRTYLRKCMTFKAVKQLNLIGEMKSFKKPYCSICMEEHNDHQKAM